MAIVSKLYLSGNLSIANTGSFDEVTINPISLGLAVKQYANGLYSIAGIFDEVTSFVGTAGEAIMYGDGTYSGTGVSGTGTLTSGPPGYYTFTWTVPAGVTSICVLCVGAGGGGGRNQVGQGGGGGAVVWVNNITVTPTTSYTIQAGLGGLGQTGTGSGNTGGDSWFNTSSYIKAVGGFGGAGTLNAGVGTDLTSATYLNSSGFSGGGGNGGTAKASTAGSRYSGGGGGGAAGYSGLGGQGTSAIYSTGTPLGGNATDGQGGGGGGGGCIDRGSGRAGAGGGGVGLFGQGGNGVAGTSGYSANTTSGSPLGGGGGSGGANGLSVGTGTFPGPGGNYGGGGGGGTTNSGGYTGGDGGIGAVRIIWGTGRAFPSTSAFTITSINENTASSLFSNNSNLYIPTTGIFDEVTGI
jgi:hypothetical protein